MVSMSSTPKNILKLLDQKDLDIQVSYMFKTKILQ